MFGRRRKIAKDKRFINAFVMKRESINNELGPRCHSEATECYKLSMHYAN